MLKHQSVKEKTIGTVNLLKQALLSIAGISVAGFFVALWVNYAIGLIITGVGLFAVGGTIVSFRRLIWDAYQGSYDKSKKKSFWLQPSRISYKINIWLIMPLLMLAGVATVLLGVFAEL